MQSIEAAQREAAVSGFASASISTSNGSKSWSRMSLSEITSLLNSLRSQLDSLRRQLAGSSTSTTY